MEKTCSYDENGNVVCRVKNVIVSVNDISLHQYVTIDNMFKMRRICHIRKDNSNYYVILNDFSEYPIGSIQKVSMCIPEHLQSDFSTLHLYLSDTISLLDTIIKNVSTLDMNNPDNIDLSTQMLALYRFRGSLYTVLKGLEYLTNGVF